MWKGRWSEIRNVLVASVCIKLVGGSKSAHERTRPPHRAQSQPSGSSRGPSTPTARRVLWAEGAEKCRGGRCRLSCKPGPHRESSSSSFGPTWLRPHRPSPASPREGPCPSSHGRAAWQAGSGQQPSGQQEMVQESAFLPEAALPALGASCLPSSCGGRGYRRAHTRRTRSRWREQPSAGLGTGP